METLAHCSPNPCPLCSWDHIAEATLPSPPSECGGGWSALLGTGPSKPPACSPCTRLPGLTHTGLVTQGAACGPRRSTGRGSPGLGPRLGESRRPPGITIWTSHQQEVHFYFKLLRICSSSIMVAAITLNNIQLSPLSSMGKTFLSETEILAELNMRNPDGNLRTQKI